MTVVVSDSPTNRLNAAWTLAERLFSEQKFPTTWIDVEGSPGMAKGRFGWAKAGNNQWRLCYHPGDCPKPIHECKIEDRCRLSLYLLRLWEACEQNRRTMNDGAAAASYAIRSFLTDRLREIDRHRVFARSPDDLLKSDLPTNPEE